MRATRAPLAVVLAMTAMTLLLPGCRPRCAGLSPRVEIAFTLGAEIDRSRVAALRAVVSIDGLAPRGRDLTASECGILGGEDRFVIVFDAASTPPARRLAVALLALDRDGLAVGQSQSASPLDLAANGCNFLSVAIGEKGASADAGGRDNKWSDRPAIDGLRSDSRVDSGFLPRCTAGFCSVPSGSFIMGSPQGTCGSSHEWQHVVTLTHPFEIGEHEVTQQEFTSLLGYNPAEFGGCNDCPVEHAHWHEAAAYCNALSAASKLGQCYSCSGALSAARCQAAAGFEGSSIYRCPGYRLPTEAEWEYAYRAGTTTDFYVGPINDCNGDDASADKIGWYQANADGKTHSVCGKQKNAAGLCDMAGNVREWTYDVNLGTNYYPGPSETDPVTPPSFATTPHMVIRGGDWYSDPHSLRAACRGGDGLPPDWSDSGTGFRCVRTNLPY